MLNVIINEKLYDESFVKEWTNASFLVRLDSLKILRESDVKKDGSPNKFVVWNVKANDVAIWDPASFSYYPANAEAALFGTFKIHLADGGETTCKTVWTMLKDRFSEYSPKKVADITWLDEDDIIKAAGFYAKSKPSAIHWGVASTDHIGPNAVPAAQAITLLRCITGNLDTPGGNVIARDAFGLITYPFKAGVGPVAPPPPEVFYNKRIGAWKYPLVRNFRAWALSDVAVDQMYSGKPYPIKAAWMQSCNPIAGQSPEPKKLLEVMKKLNFIVVVDLFLTPTA